VIKMELIKQPKSRFLKVKCKKCEKEQVIFGTPSSIVKCNSCNEILAKPTGGKTSIRSKILEVLE